MRQKGIRSVHTYPSYLKVCDLYTGQYIHCWYSGMLLFANGPVCVGAVHGGVCRG
jgi:hypothetical protein